MKNTLSRDDVVRGLHRRGFELVDAKPRAYAESWRHPDFDELVNVKRNDSYPMVIDPKHEARVPLLLREGVVRGRKQYSFNSNYYGFPAKKNAGEREERYGIDFGFESAASLEAFVDALLDQGTQAEQAALDTEALRFLDGFMASDNLHFVNWLPRYTHTLARVREALSRNAPEDLFELVWKSRDNAVSNAGQGVMGFKTADRLRGKLVEVIRDITADGSPAGFEAIVGRFEQWRAQGELASVPRLLVARAFAAIHPEHYHTTVDATKQDRIIPWFAEHTGFVVPEGNWATKAAALSAHLERCGVFGDDLERRNMFPWFVFEQMRDASGKVAFQPGHTPRPASGKAHSRAELRTVEYRHNIIQDQLFLLLCERHGENAVRTEHPTGTGGRADALVRRPDGCYELYEIKPATTAADAVRQAMGQLLEYAYRRGGIEPAALHVVSDAPLDDVTSAFLSRLQSEFGLPIEYLQVACERSDGVLTALPES